MPGGHAHFRLRALTVAGAAVVLGSLGILSACSTSPAGPTAGGAPASAAAKAASDKAAAVKASAEQSARLKAEGQKYIAAQKRADLAAAKEHPVAKAAAACGIPVRYIDASPNGTRIGAPDVPRRGDIWHVKKTSPVSPGMIIYWPDGGKVLCRPL